MGLKLNNRNTQVAEALEVALLSRGFTIEELSKHGIGVCCSLRGPFFGYLHNHILLVIGVL